MELLVRSVNIDQSFLPYTDKKFDNMPAAMEFAWRQAWTGNHLYVVVADLCMTILCQFGPFKQMYPDVDPPIMVIGHK